MCSCVLTLFRGSTEACRSFHLKTNTAVLISDGTGDVMCWRAIRRYCGWEWGNHDRKKKIGVCYGERCTFLFLCKVSNKTFTSLQVLFCQKGNRTTFAPLLLLLTLDKWHLLLVLYIFLMEVTMRRHLLLVTDSIVSFTFDMIIHQNTS